MNQETGKEPSLGRLFRLFFKHWMLICFITLGALLTVLLYSYVFPPVYVSSSKLMIRYGRENIPHNPIGKITAPFSTMTTWEQTVKSEIELVRNQYLAQEVVDILGPDFDAFPPRPPPTTLWDRAKARAAHGVKTVAGSLSDLLYQAGLLERLPSYESAIKRVMGGLEVSMVTDSSVIDVRFRSFNPSAAKVVLELILDLYLRNRLEVYKEVGTYEFFEEQVAEQDRFLKSSVQELSDFKVRNAVSIIGKQVELLLTKVDVLREKLFIFQIDLIKARARYAENAAEVVLQKRLIEATQQELATMEAELTRLLKFEPDLARLQVQQRVSEDNYYLYYEKKEDAKIMQTMTRAHISNVSLVQPASVPIQPVRTLPMAPNKTFRLIVALILGPSLGFSLALLSEYFNPSVTSARDLEEILSVPVWCAIPEDRSIGL